MNTRMDIPYIMHCTGEFLAPTLDAIVRRIQSLEDKVDASPDTAADLHYKLWPGGEVHAEYSGQPYIVRDYSMNGLMALAQSVEISRRIAPSHPIRIVYPYLPYARQDRVMGERDPFSLKMFALFLNALQLESVTMLDPHSDVAPALIERSIVVPQHQIVRKCVPADVLERAMIISPDAGSYKKVRALVSDDRRVGIGVKTRSPDGSICGTDIYAIEPVSGDSLLIVDDICDGGRTFIELAQCLYAKSGRSLGVDPEYGCAPPNRLDLRLYVTHGIFSRGFDELGRWFSAIYTTDSFIHKDTPDFVHVTKVEDILPCS